MMKSSDGGDTPPAAGYTDEMRKALDHLATLGPEPYDFTYPPDDDIRRVDAERVSIWNMDLPEVASIRHLILPGDAAIGAADCEAAVYTPEDAGEGLIFFVHGGGWAFQNLQTYDRFMRVLCNEARTVVVGVHYRLAPEHPYPAALHDVVSAFRYVLGHRDGLGLPGGPVVIAGDSAGGNLALATLLHEQAAGREMPVGGLLIYGVFGADFETPSYREHADGHGLTRFHMQQFWDWYVPNVADRSNPVAAPLQATDAQLRILPPLFLVVAEYDPLASDTLHLKQRLDGLGRSDILWSERGVIHGFVQMTAMLESARRVMREAAEAARRFMAGQ
ncbi:alpha/beta hydrolase [Sphingobium amiense]|nr:alpha/beta hydrolase [Sphingobium amiense]